MTSPDALVRVTTAAGVTTLTLDSPHNRNALSTRLMTELVEALAAAVTDDAVRVVVLSHTGPVFCSGADLKESAQAYATGTLPAGMLGDVLAAIRECPKPVVARVAGPARAGGLGLIAAADLAVCAEEATFAFTEVRIGVIPAVISATVLPLLTPRAAAELYLTGEKFDAVTAQEIGLITTAVTDAGALDDIVAGWCADLRKGSPQGLAASKALTTTDTLRGFDRDASRLVEESAALFASDEARAGMTAFLTKQPPPWVAT